MSNRIRFYLGLAVFCCGYWFLDSLWSYASFETNLRMMIFREPDSYLDTLLLRVPPYQVLSRLMVTGLFLLTGALLFEAFMKKRRAERAYLESEEKYEVLVKNADDAIFIVQDDRIRFPNPKTYRLTAYPEPELETISFGGLIHPKDRRQVRERLEKRVAGEPLHATDSFRIVTRDDEVRWVQMSSSRITWEGSPATLNIVRDVTPEVKAEERQRRTQKMEAIGTLAGGIAHDINNILGIILGNAELSLDEPNLPEPVRRNLGVIAKACLRAKDVVKQLLRFNRGMEGELKPIRLASVVEDFTGFIRASIPNSIDIRLEIDDRQTAVRADSTQIQQVLLNLCTNAAQAMPEMRGVLIVGIESVRLESEAIDELPAGRYLRLSVQDDGCGIPTPVVDRVFDPYFTTKGLGIHSGMGLSVVHGVVKNHGGQVIVESAEGQGTRVSVYLPVTNEAAAETPKDQETKTPPGGDETILVVDDEKPLTSLARQILERLGYRVETLNDPRAAFELLRKNPDRFDLVITDLTMPHMTGDRLAAEIRSIRPEMPIILCTGYSEQMNKINTQPAGIGGYLEKPLDRVQLAETIRSVLDGRPPASPPPH